MKHSEYKEFFEELASKHKKIAHTKARPKFFAWDKDFIRDKQHNIQYPIMMLSPLGGNLRDNKVGFVKDTKTGGFVILISEKRAATDAARREDIYDETFQIGLDIIAKIKERAAIGNCEKLYFDLNRVSYELIDYPWLDNCYGYAFLLPLSKSIDLTSNPLIWLP
jgi:hypothetical protein